MYLGVKGEHICREGERGGNDKANVVKFLQSGNLGEGYVGILCTIFVVFL